MKRSIVLALVSTLSTGCAFVPWSTTGSEESDPNKAGQSGDSPQGEPAPDPVDDPGSSLVTPDTSRDAPFFTDTGDDGPDAPEPGSDIPLEGEFVSVAVGELDSVTVDSVYDQKEGEDICGEYFRVARSDGMGNTLVIEGWEMDGYIDFAARLDQLKRVDGEWQRLVAYVGPNFKDTEYTVDLRSAEGNQGDVVINITRAIGIGPSENGWVDGDLFVRLRGSCFED